MHQSWWSIVVHAALFVTTLVWALDRESRLHWKSGVMLAIAISCLWLVVSPTFVVIWERRLRKLQTTLEETGEFDDAAVHRIQRATARWRPLSAVLVAIPIALIMIAFHEGDSFLQHRVGLPLSGVEYWVAGVVLLAGSASGGFGFARASRTIFLARALASERGHFSPYSGVPSKMANAVADFCFSGAVLFGVGSSLLAPALTAATVGCQGAARVALIIVELFILSLTVALLGVPAFFLSRHHSLERDAYLGTFSGEIDVLAKKASEGNQPLTEEEYRRLRSLLELRSHLVQQSVGLPSVDMVKRIPLAVIVPVGSTAAAWLAVLVH